ncbi:MAG TPA: hypothetical protein VGZ25_06215 [Gemmataceae bacterium]|nr:hypothetical protein [Gemmataceae bacterium]
MRRLMFSLSALGFVTVMAGCHHTAGACDCEGGPHGAIISPASPIKPEPIKEAPKEIKKTSAVEETLEIDGTEK